MREILFRGKRCDNGEWVKGYYIRADHHWHKNGIHKDWITLGASANGGWFALHSKYAVKAETVGQFTGLSDKNGKKIFEGDVVKFTDSPFGYSYTGTVCFNEGSFCIKYEYWKKEKFHRIGQTDKWQDMGASGIVTYQYEILGNIHDNPELLENP